MCLDRAVVAPPAGSPSVVPSVVTRGAYDRAAPVPQSKNSIPGTKPSSQLPPKQRVVAWFTQYDQIRRDAHMTRAEKSDAIRLWASSYVQRNDRDSQDARAIFSRMVVRYDSATKHLTALSQIPETQSLQKGYLEYFRRAHANFRRYVETLNKQSTGVALAQMHEGRQQLSALDARNKSLDRQLRLKHNIPEFVR